MTDPSLSFHAGGQPGRSRPTVMVTIQHFVFVAPLSHCCSPSSDRVQKPLQRPQSPHKRHRRTFSPVFSSKQISVTFCFSAIRFFPSQLSLLFFFSFGRPSHLPKHTHTQVLIHTSIQTTSCPFVHRQEPFVWGNAQTGLQLHTFLCLPSFVRTLPASQVQCTSGGGWPGRYKRPIHQQKTFILLV